MRSRTAGTATPSHTSVAIMSDHGEERLLGLPEHGSEGSASDRGRITAQLALSAAVATLGAAQFGYQIGVLNVPQTTIENDLAIPHNSFKWSAIVAAFTITALFGAQLSGSLMDSWGRKPFLRWYSLIFAVGGALELVSGLARANQVAAYAILIIARVLMGLGCGAASVIVPLYLGEIAHTPIKGAFGALNQLVLTGFILLSQALGLGMSRSSLWPWMLFVASALGIIGFIASALLVESPRWLVSKGKLEEARKILQSVRGYSASDCELELREIEQSSQAGSSAGAYTLVSVLRNPDYRMPIVSIVALQIAQQLSGINAVFFYSTTFFQDAGVQNANYGTLATGAVNVIATLAAVLLIDRAGRKPLLLLGAIGMLLSAAALTITLVMKDSHPDQTSGLGVASILFVLLFVTFFELGLGSIPWLIGGEMLPEGPRATGMGIGAAVNWIFTTVIALFFPQVQEGLGNYSFLPFCGFLFVAIGYVYVFVPETKGRSPAEILSWYQGKRVAVPVGQPKGSVQVYSAL